MKKILFVALLLAGGLLAQAKSFYINSNYVKHLDGGGLPSAYKGAPVLLEIDTSDLRLIRHNAVQMEPEYYTFMRGKFYEQGEEGRVYVGSLTWVKGNIIMTEKYSTAKTPYIDVQKLLPETKGIADAESIIRSLNKRTLPGVFNLKLFLKGDTTRYNNVVFRTDGSIVIGEDAGFASEFSTFISCLKSHDLIKLVIDSVVFEFILEARPGSATEFLLFARPNAPCDPKKERAGTLTKTIAKL
jgi:hypothetical protein